MLKVRLLYTETVNGLPLKLLVVVVEEVNIVEVADELLRDVTDLSKSEFCRKTNGVLGVKTGGEHNNVGDGDVLGEYGSSGNKDMGSYLFGGKILSM